MPKKKRKAATADHLSTALESLRKRPRPQLGLESDGKLAPLGYVTRVGSDTRGDQGAAERKRAGKLRMAFNLPVELCERARNAVWHLADHVQINLSTLCERTLEREVTRLEKKYNDGRPFPERKGRLKGGARREPERRAKRRGSGASGD